LVGPTTEKERVCIVAERVNWTTKLPWTEDRSALVEGEQMNRPLATLLKTNGRGKSNRFVA